MKVSNRAIPTIVVATAAAVLVTIAACQATPTATSVSVPPTATSTIPPATTSTPTPTPTQPPTATPTSTAEPAQAAGVCGQQGRTTVLLVGESLPEDRPARGASAIRLVRVDYDAGTVRVLSLPPYLWVETPALSAAGVDATALTLAYWEALDLGSGSDRARMAYATSILSQTLAHNFGLAPDHTISIRQGAFIDAVDALGGLSIDLPEDVDGSPSGFGTYRAGRQVLDGRAVLDYISIYPAVGDEPPLEWERLARQQQVLQALQAQLARPQTLLQLPGLVRQFYQDVITDLGLEQVLALGCLFSPADVSIEFVELPADLATPGEDGILLPKTDEIVAYLETAFAP
jgi:anionic cell wall polymer biosynthesis LytR-Cps2A-Psr (LCP) family protein